MRGPGLLELRGLPILEAAICPPAGDFGPAALRRAALCCWLAELSQFLEVENLRGDQWLETLAARLPGVLRAIAVTDPKLGVLQHLMCPAAARALLAELERLERPIPPDVARIEELAAALIWITELAELAPELEGAELPLGRAGVWHPSYALSGSLTPG